MRDKLDRELRDTLIFSPISSRWNREYAKKWNHGFERHTSGCTLAARAPQWTKIALLYEELLRPELNEWVVWIDADAIFTNYEEDVADLLEQQPQKKVLVLGRDLGRQFGRPINTGFMAVRAGGRGRQLLQQIWAKGAWLRKRYLFGHEQEALTRLMDEDKDVRHQVKVLKDTVRMFSEKVGKDDHHLWRKGDLVAHAAGWPGVRSKIQALKLMRRRSIL